MPLRDDFERVYYHPYIHTELLYCVENWCGVQEYNNGLEEVISEITIGADEEEVERELKLAHIDIYNKGLVEREKRKRYVQIEWWTVCSCFKSVLFCSVAKQHGLIAGKQRLSGRHSMTVCVCVVTLLLPLYTAMKRKLSKEDK